MKFFVRLFTNSLLITLISNVVLAQETRDTIEHEHKKFIKINPYKPFLGIANLGLEFQLNRQLSFSIFGEYLLRDKLIVGKDVEHPVFVFEVSPRYYLSENETMTGFFIGPIAGFTLKRKHTKEAQGLILGIESGYKFILGKKERVFIEPKLIVLHNFSATEKFLPGIEGHFGLRLK